MTRFCSVVSQCNGGIHLTDTEREEIARTYLSPVFKVDDEEHKGLLEEAAVVRSRLEVGVVAELVGFGGCRIDCTGGMTV
jgi:hypothetical protein